MKYKLRHRISSLIFYGFIFLTSQSSCKKLIEIKPPDSSITTGQVFADSIDANSAILGIYSNMINDGSIACGFETVYSGMSADELLPLLSEGEQFSKNILNQSNPQVNGGWT